MRNGLDEVTNGFSSASMTSGKSLRTDPIHRGFHGGNGTPTGRQHFPNFDPRKDEFLQCFARGNQNKSGDKLGYVLRISVNYINLTYIYNYNIYIY